MASLLNRTSAIELKVMFSLSTTMLFRAVVLVNAYSPMLVTVAGIVMLVSETALKKA